MNVSHAPSGDARAVSSPSSAPLLRPAQSGKSSPDSTATNRAVLQRGPSSCMAYKLHVAPAGEWPPLWQLPGTAPSLAVFPSTPFATKYTQDPSELKPVTAPCPQPLSAPLAGGRSVKSHRSPPAASVKSHTSTSGLPDTAPDAPVNS